MVDDFSIDNSGLYDKWGQIMASHRVVGYSIFSNYKLDISGMGWRTSGPADRFGVRLNNCLWTSFAGIRVQILCGYEVSLGDSSVPGGAPERYPGPP